jgi:predicted RNA-binding Zn ribbon-like protein
MPRYDVPKAAPEPLRRVQLFLNTENHENGDDWLVDWLREHGETRRRARAERLRRTLRAFALANNGFDLEAEAVSSLNAELERLGLEVGPDARVGIRGRGGALDDVLAVAAAAMLDGSFGRLKACRNCHWSFFDYSPNRSATWCSMQLCGNRRKTRAYRRRRTARS